MKNQLLQQLANDAGLYVDLNGKPWPRNMNGEDIEGAYQKFAESIVRECANQVKHVYKQGGGNYGEAILGRFGLK
jgi:hypothetical protein